MKRLLSITMTVLIAALLIVSCNVETGNIDDSLALITFSAGERETRSLTRTNPQLDPDDFYWYYTATKKDGTGLTTGATSTEKAVTSGKGLGTDPVGPFSYGVWEFELFGYAGENKTNLAYSGKASITIKDTTNNLVVTVESKQSDNVDGHLDFPAKGDIKLTGTDINSESVAYSSLIEAITFKRVDGKKEFEKTVYNYENTERNGGVRRYDLESGSYSVTFTYWQNAKLSDDKETFTQGEGFKVAEETIYVAIADYLTTTIGGDIASNTGSVSISVKNGIVEVKVEDVAIKNDGTATELNLGAAPVSKDKTDTTAANAVKTTILIPSGALTGTTVSATTTSYTREAVASSKPTFTIEEKTTTGDGTTTTTTEAVVLGGLDIDLYVDDSTEKSTDFSGDKALTITTYIATGLNGNQDYTYSETNPTCDIAVKYDGDGADGTVKSYNATTGELVFEVTHLSTYYFVSKNAVVFNTTKSSAHETLEDAITKASSGDTLTLLKSVEVTTDKNGIKIDKSLTIDLGGNTITSTNRLFLVHNGTLTLDNGTIKIADTGDIGATSSMVRVSCDEADCATTEALGFVLKKGATIEGTKSYGVTAFGNKDATIDIYGTIVSGNAALAGSGSEGNTGKFVFNVYDGASLSSTGDGTTCNDAAGIYMPDNDGTLNIYGGTITSSHFSALEVRWGNVNIYGGTLKSEENSYSTRKTPSDGGPTVMGAALAVSPYGSSTQTGFVNVVISGGIFEGRKQIAVVNPDEKKAEVIDSIKVEIKSGCNFAADKIHAVKSSVSEGVVDTYTIAPDTLWDGVSATTNWYSDNPNSFEISKASDLAGLAKLVNQGTSFEGKTVTLMADIDLGEYNWTPIGQYKDENGNDFTKQFSGTFDGNNHTIKGLKIDCTTGKSSYRALFGYVDGTVKNFTVYGEVAGIDVAGVVAALDKGGVVDSVTSYVNVSNKAENATTAKTGGIIITNKNKNSKEAGWIISNCKNYGTVSSNSTVASDSVGGILGWTADQTGKLEIKNCYNYGKVSAVNQPAGGIVGGCRSIIIEGCTNEGTICSGSAAAGGIVAYNDTTNLTIKNCSNSGSVTGASNITGAIGGLIKGFLEDCTTTEDIALVGTLGDGENSISYSSETTITITAPFVVKGSLSLKNVKVSSLSLIYVNRAGDLTVALDSSTIDSMTVTMEQNEGESRLFLTKEGTSSIGSLKFTGSFDAQNINTYGKLYLFGNEVVSKDKVTNELIYIERHENNDHPDNASIYWNATGTKDSYTDSTTDPIQSIKTYNSSTSKWETSSSN